MEHEELRQFYRTLPARERILEYCAGARGIAGYGGPRRLAADDGAPVPCFSSTYLDGLLSEGADACRSVDDRVGTLVLLDIDYVNHDDPAEPYREPARCFERLEPVYGAVRKVFAEYGIRPLMIMTGKGYHVVGRVSMRSAFHEALAAMGVVSRPLMAKYGRVAPGVAEKGRAHDAVGRLLEYLGHRVIATIGEQRHIPVTLADLQPDRGGPFICLDLSGYGDPLHERFVRCAFSSNQKAHMERLSAERPLVVSLPRRPGESLASLVRARESQVALTELAAEVSVRIPRIGGRGAFAWLEDYRSSPLGAFHREFDRGWHDEPAEWPFTYDQLDLSTLPGKVRSALEYPNPMLLKPTNMRAVALHLWREGWHPRSIAGLFRSKFERDFGWGNYWYRYDAATRADFYVRVLCGAVAVDLDALASKPAPAA